MQLKISILTVLAILSCCHIGTAGQAPSYRLMSIREWQSEAIARQNPVPEKKPNCTIWELRESSPLD
jgi:hypothetical protein